jgi:tRNA(Arg) A34 adenosine deaminase TadA
MEEPLLAGSSCKDPQGVDGTVDGPWRPALALAWEAFRAGTIPVGAVVVNGAGELVAQGRNRIFEPHDGIVGTRLAHAEVLALTQLPAPERYDDHVLYSTLEPCSLCAGAVLHSTVGAVRYLAADPWAGGYVASVPPRFRTRAPVVDGPQEGPAVRISVALQIAFWLQETRPNAAAIVAAFEGATPGATAVAERLLADELPAGFEEALPRLLVFL